MLLTFVLFGALSSRDAGRTTCRAEARSTFIYKHGRHWTGHDNGSDSAGTRSGYSTLVSQYSTAGGPDFPIFTARQPRRARWCGIQIHCSHALMISRASNRGPWVATENSKLSLAVCRLQRSGHQNLLDTELVWRKLTWLYRPSRLERQDRFEGRVLPMPLRMRWNPRFPPDGVSKQRSTSPISSVSIYGQMSPTEAPTSS